METLFKKISGVLLHHGPSPQ